MGSGGLGARVLFRQHLLVSTKAGSFSRPVTVIPWLELQGMMRGGPTPLRALGPLSPADTYIESLLDAVWSDTSVSEEAVATLSRRCHTPHVRSELSHALLGRLRDSTVGLLHSIQPLLGPPPAQPGLPAE